MDRHKTHRPHISGHIFFVLIMSLFIFGCGGGGGVSNSSVGSQTSSNQSSLNTTIDNQAVIFSNGDRVVIMSSLHQNIGSGFKGSMLNTSDDVIAEIGKNLKNEQKPSITESQSIATINVKITANKSGGWTYVTLEFRKDSNNKWKLYNMY